MDKQNITMVFDDSGVISKNSRYPYFVYAGYTFIDDDSRNKARNHYKKINQGIKKELKLGKGEELKAYGLKIKYRQALYNALKKEYKQAGIVYIPKIYNSILENKNSIVRFKDYILKRIVKNRISTLINKGIIFNNIETTINIYIDEQLTCSNGFYRLKEGIQEELNHGICNFNYGVYYNNIFQIPAKIDVRFCDSKNNYLIQASDILANRLFNACIKNDQKLKNIDKAILLNFP